MPAAQWVQHNIQVVICAQDLPEQCVVEDRSEGLMVSLGFTVMLLELAAMYCTLSFVLYVPHKRE